MNKGFIYLKNIFSILCLVCVIALYIFKDNIASYFMEQSYTGTQHSYDLGESSITVENQQITYSGEASFDFFNGVFATDIDGSDISDKITYQILPSKNLSQKIIRYSILNSNYQELTKDSVLILNDYNGPSVTLADNLSLEDYDISTLVTSLCENGEIYADDGYGNNISDSIYFSYTIADPATPTYELTFFVTNAYGDSSSTSVITKLNSSAFEEPSIALIQHTVTISKGSVFNANDYIQYAFDPVDGDISSSVETEGFVTTDKIGEYTIYYYAKNSNGEYSQPAELTVYVR